MPVVAPRRRFIRVALVAATTLVLGVTTLTLDESQAAAQPETGVQLEAQAYVYWSYYQWREGEWMFSSSGAAGSTPEDGAVEGWRFGLADEATPRYPRTDGDFELICGSTPAEDERKRVAVVIDYGIDEEAPEGEEAPVARGACAVVDPDASGMDVLASVAEVRRDGGLACGIDGYPAEGCGQPSDTEPSAAESESPVELQLPADQQADSDGNQGGRQAADAPGEEDGTGRAGTFIVAAVALVVLVAFGGWLTARRRSERQGPD